MERGEIYEVAFDPVVGDRKDSDRFLRRLGKLPSQRMGEIRAALDRHLWF